MGASTFGDWIGRWKQLKNWVLHRSDDVPDSIVEGGFYYDNIKQKPMYYDGTKAKPMGSAYTYAGVISYPPPEWTDNGGGSVTMSGCKVRLHDNANFVGDLEEYDVPAKTFQLVDGADSLLVAYYNAGTPEYFLVDATNYTQYNLSDNAMIYRFWYAFGEVHSASSDSLGLGLAEKLALRAGQTAYYARVGDKGLILKQSATPVPRTVTVTAADVWAGAVELTVNPFDSSVNKMEYLYKDAGGVWVSTVSTVFPNTLYNPAAGLATLSNPAKWTAIFVYRTIGDKNEVYLVLDTEEYISEPSASGATKRTDLPSIVRSHCMLIGRILVQSGASTGTIQSAFDTVFQTASVSTAAEISSDPTGSIAATNVQAAITELDAEKAPVNTTLADNPASSTLPTAGTSTAIAALLQQIRDYLKYLLAQIGIKLTIDRVNNGDTVETLIRRVRSDGTHPAVLTWDGFRYLLSGGWRFISAVTMTDSLTVTGNINEGGTNLSNKYAPANTTLADNVASSTLPTAGTATAITLLLQQVRDNLKSLFAKLTDGSVTKVGTATVGSTSKGVYLNAGVPTAMSATVGSATQPVYLNAGTVTAITGTIGNATTGNAATATKLATARTITVDSTDMTAVAVSFDGSANITVAPTLDATGVTAGTYTKLTVDAKGRATAGAAAAVADITGLQTALEGKAPTSHASPTNEHGPGTADDFGHVQLVDSVASGVQKAVTSNAVANAIASVQPKPYTYAGSNGGTPGWLSGITMTIPKSVQYRDNQTIFCVRCWGDTSSASQWTARVMLSIKIQNYVPSYKLVVLDGDNYLGKIYGRYDQNVNHHFFTPEFYIISYGATQVDLEWGDIPTSFTGEYVASVPPNAVVATSFDNWLELCDSPYARVQLNSSTEKGGYRSLCAPGQMRMNFMSSTENFWGGIYNENDPKGNWLLLRDSEGYAFTSYPLKLSKGTRLDDSPGTGYFRITHPYISNQGCEIAIGSDKAYILSYDRTGGGAYRPLKIDAEIVDLTRQPTYVQTVAASTDDTTAASTAWVKDVCPQLSTGFSAGTSIVYQSLATSRPNANTVYFCY